MDINNKQELIAELENFHKAVTRVNELENYRNNVMPDESRTEIKNKKKEFGTLERIPTIFDIEIAFFEFDVDKLNEKRRKLEKFQKIFRIVLIVTGVSLILYNLFNIYSVSSIMVIGFMASVFMGLKYFQDKKNLKNDEDKYNNLTQKYNDSVNNFNHALQNYEEEKLSGIKAAQEYGKTYRKYYAEAEKIFNSYLEKIEDITREEFELNKQIQSFDLIDESYQHLTTRIIANLKSSRADTLREALNIAIDEERQEQYEAQRRYEEEQRAIREQLRLEAEQEEIRRHNMEIERQAAVQAKAAEDAARVAADTARRQATAERQAMGDSMRAQSAANARCNRCANYNACGNSRGIVNCGAFRPKTY